MKARTIFMSLPKRKRYQSGEIPGVLDQGQGCSGARASKVTVGWTKRVKTLYRVQMPQRQLRRREVEIEVFDDIVLLVAMKTQAEIGSRRESYLEAPQDRPWLGAAEIFSQLCVRR